MISSRECLFLTAFISVFSEIGYCGEYSERNLLVAYDSEPILLSTMLSILKSDFRDSQDSFYFKNVWDWNRFKESEVVANEQRRLLIQATEGKLHLGFEGKGEIFKEIHGKHTHLLYIRAIPINPGIQFQFSLLKNLHPGPGSEKFTADYEFEARSEVWLTPDDDELNLKIAQGLKRLFPGTNDPPTMVATINGKALFEKAQFHFAVRDTISIDASRSRDSDNPRRCISYSWIAEKIEGSTAAPAEKFLRGFQFNESQMDIFPTVVGRYRIIGRVSDGLDSSTADTINFNVHDRIHIGVGRAKIFKVYHHAILGGVDSAIGDLKILHDAQIGRRLTVKSRSISDIGSQFDSLDCEAALLEGFAEVSEEQFRKNRCREYVPYLQGESNESDGLIRTSLRGVLPTGIHKFKLHLIDSATDIWSNGKEFQIEVDHRRAFFIGLGYKNWSGYGLEKKSSVSMNLMSLYSGFFIWNEIGVELQLLKDLSFFGDTVSNMFSPGVIIAPASGVAMHFFSVYSNRDRGIGNFSLLYAFGMTGTLDPFRKAKRRSPVGLEIEFGWLSKKFFGGKRYVEQVSAMSFGLNFTTGM